MRYLATSNSAFSPAEQGAELCLAAGLGFEPRISQIQSLACYHYTTRQEITYNFERRTGIEPATFSLARRHSTGELPPHFSANRRIGVNFLSVFLFSTVTNLLFLFLFEQQVFYQKISANIPDSQVFYSFVKAS